MRAAGVARLLSWVSFVVAWQVSIPLLPTLLVPTPAEVGEFMWDEIRGDTLAPQTVYEAFATSLERLGARPADRVRDRHPDRAADGAVARRRTGSCTTSSSSGSRCRRSVWALIAAMWFGFGTIAPLITVVLAAWTFVVINVAEGVRNVPKDLIDMGRAYGVSRLDSIRYVIFPSLMPFFFAALRYALANAWKGLVLAELFASTNGAGWTIKFWYDAHRAQGIIGYALFFVIFALIVERLIFGRLSAYVFRWRPSSPALRKRKGVTVGTISVQNLRKEFVSDDSTVVALESASFEVSGHEFVSVVGPSGCGKSTLLNILSGIETPTSGVVEITEGGRDARLGYVFQAARLLPWRSVIDNMLFVQDDRDARDPRALRALPRHGRARPHGEASSRASSPAACSSGSASRARSRSSPTCC